MQLKITYKEGEKRVVNLSQEFFEDTPIKDSRTRKTIVLTPMSKAQTLVGMYGDKPHTIELTTPTGEMLINQINGGNEPVVVRFPYKESNEEKVEKKRLRNHYKNQKFTVRVSLGKVHELAAADAV